MNKKNVAFEFQNKIRKYITSTHGRHFNNALSEIKLIDHLSISLKEELLLKSNKGVIDKFPFFKENFSEETLRKITLKMKFKNFFPEEPITQVIFNNFHSIFTLKKRLL